MKLLFTLLAGTLLASCTSTLPQETFRQNGVTSSSIETQIESIGGETPATTESLEVRKEGAMTIPVVLSEKQSIILGDTGSGTVRGKNPPTMQVVMDYGCEFCREEALLVRPWIVQSYVGEHRMNLEIILSPQTQQGTLHAKAAVCAAKFGFFSSMDTYLLTHPAADTTTIRIFAEKNKVKSASWKYCMDTTNFEPVLTSDGKSIERLPAFALGDMQWIGIETDSFVRQNIDRYLLSQ